MRRFGTTRVVATGLVLMSLGFVQAAFLAVDSAYFGPILASMVTMAAGLGMVSSPATEAIMGALPPAKAGVGSAVNDTTRELGGTLGVAVVGSVYASLYGPQVVEGLAGQPAEVVAAAEQSVGAAVVLAEQLPDGAEVLAVAQEAFLSGFGAGSLVAAAATAAGAVMALIWLPACA
jgi:DHA2 family multidrug resistance protein-like MFS transporter